MEYRNNAASKLPLRRKFVQSEAELINVPKNRYEYDEEDNVFIEDFMSENV